MRTIYRYVLKGLIESCSRVCIPPIVQSMKRKPAFRRAVTLGTYLAAVYAGGATVLFFFSQVGINTHPRPEFLFLIGAMALAEIFPLRLVRKGERIYFSIASTFGMALLLLCGLETAAIVHSIMWFTHGLRLRFEWRKLFFNPAQGAISYALAGATMHLLGGVATQQGTYDARGLGAFVAGATIFAIANNLLIDVAASFRTKVSLSKLLKNSFTVLGPIEGSCLLIAPIMVVAARHNLALMILMAFPIAGLYANIRLSSAYKTLVIEMDGRKALEKQLAHQAFHDSLTGLANRELFRNDLEKAFARIKRGLGSVGLMYLDLDNFKAVNDQMGHEAGDDLLRAVARCLEQSVRPSDTAARLGGDEFAVIIDSVHGANEVILVAERLLASFESIPHLDKSISIRASIGIALSDADTDDVEQLIRNADYAMYGAKSAGKNAYRLFDSDMAKRARGETMFEQELLAGIDDGQFTLHYQPIVSLPACETIGFEALVRWNHPIRGLLQPAAFVALAEEKGVIASLDRWILDEACRQLAAWKRQSPAFEALYVSVNVSGAHFENPGLVDEVAEALSKTGLKNTDLRLEITEGTLMCNKDAVVATLNGLKTLGTYVSIDDFGTGYSSLSYLRDFNLDALKIDRSFIAGVALGPEESALTKAIIRLAQTLQMEVVAEGIEECAQAEELSRLGCKAGQGFLFSRPQRAAVIEQTMLQRHHGRSSIPNRAAMAIA